MITKRTGINVIVFFTLAALLIFLGHCQAEIRSRQRLAFGAPWTGDENDVHRNAVVGMEDPRSQATVLLGGRRIDRERRQQAGIQTRPGDEPRHDRRDRTGADRVGAE